MRISRQNKILELIEKYEIETQDKLVSMLRDFGYEVTQATISRDIKELQLVKTLSPQASINMHSLHMQKDLCLTGFQIFSVKP